MSIPHKAFLAMLAEKQQILRDNHLIDTTENMRLDIQEKVVLCPLVQEKVDSKKLGIEEPLKGKGYPYNEQDEKDFKPHTMYDPKTGKGYKADTYKDHLDMKNKGYTHESVEVDEKSQEKKKPHFDMNKKRKFIVPDRKTKKGKDKYDSFKMSMSKESVEQFDEALLLASEDLNAVKKQAQKLAKQFPKMRFHVVENSKHHPAGVGKRYEIVTNVNFHMYRNEKLMFQYDGAQFGMDESVKLDEDNLKDLIAKYKKTGRSAFHYPRKKQISLDGGRAMSEKDAIKNMQRVVDESVDLDEKVMGALPGGSPTRKFSMPPSKEVEKHIMQTKKTEFAWSADSVLGGNSKFVVISIAGLRARLGASPKSGEDGVLMAIISNPDSGSRKIFSYMGTHRNVKGAQKFAKNNKLVESVELSEGKMKAFLMDVEDGLEKAMDKKWYNFLISGRALTNIIDHVAKKEGKYDVNKTIAGVLKRYGKTHDEYMKISMELAAKSRFVESVELSERTTGPTRIAVDKEFTKMTSSGKMDTGYAIKHVEKMFKIKNVKVQKDKNGKTHVISFNESVELDEKTYWKRPRFSHAGGGDWFAVVVSMGKDKGKIIHANLSKQEAHKKNKAFHSVKELPGGEAKVGQYVKEAKGITVTYVFPDDRKAKQFDLDIENSAIGIGDQIGNRVTVTDVDNRWRSTVDKYVKKNKGKLVSESVELDEAIKVRFSGLGQVTKILKKKGIGFHTSKGNIMVNPKNLIAAKSALNKEFGGDFEKKTGMKLKGIEKIGISDGVELDEAKLKYSKDMPDKSAHVAARMAMRSKGIQGTIRDNGTIHVAQRDVKATNDILKKKGVKGFRATNESVQLDEDDVERKEIELFTSNHAQIYRQRIQPIIKNLSKKKAKGTYDDKLAIKAWTYAVNDGIKAYNKEFGSSIKLSGAEKAKAAEYLLKHFGDE